MKLIPYKITYINFLGNIREKTIYAEDMIDAYKLFMQKHRFFKWFNELIDIDYDYSTLLINKEFI